MRCCCSHSLVIVATCVRSGNTSGQATPTLTPTPVGKSYGKLLQLNCQSYELIKYLNCSF